MFFKEFDLGNGSWAKFGLTAKLGERFISGVKCWVLEKGRTLPLLLNTVITNAPDARVTTLDGFPAKQFLADGEIKGFSTTSEIMLTIKRNGHAQIIHGRWDKEECEDDRTLFKFRAWEEKPRKEKPVNKIMADAIEAAFNQENHKRRNNGDKQHWSRREEKSRYFKQNRTSEKKKTLQEYMAET